MSPASAMTAEIRFAAGAAGPRLARLAASALLCVALAPAMLAQPPVPELGGRATDHGNVLSPATEQALEALLADLEAATGAQLAVLTVASLESEPVESYSLRVAETWGLGSRERDDGVLLLVAVADRKARIEVGYGLEGTLPDVVAGRIIRESMVPHFRRGDYDAGVLAGAQAIVDRLHPGGAEAVPPATVSRVAGVAEAVEVTTNWDHFALWLVFLIGMPAIGLVFALFAKTAETRGITFGLLMMPVLLGGSLAADEVMDLPDDSGAFLLGGVAAIAVLSVPFWWLHLRLRKRPEARRRWRERLDRLADGSVLYAAAAGLGLPVPAEASGRWRWLRRGLAALLYLAVGALLWKMWRPGYAVFYLHNLFWLFVIYRATLHPSPSSSSSRSWSGRSSRSRSSRRSSWSSSSRRSGGFRPGGGSFGGGGASGSW